MTRAELTEAVARAMRVRVTVNLLRQPAPITHEWIAGLTDALADAALAVVAEAMREPTPEMFAAWYRVKNGHHFHDGPPPADTSDYAAYRAMIAASPLAEAPDAE